MPILMPFDDHIGVVHYDEREDVLRAEVRISGTGGLHFQGRSLDELREKFHEALDGHHGTDRT